MQKLISILSILLLSLSIGQTTNKLNAATITRGENDYGYTVISINGQIVKGDLKRIQDVAARVTLNQKPFHRSALNFHINTPGGDVYEAMKIGRFFRKILATVDTYGATFIAEGSKEAERLLAEERAGNSVPFNTFIVPSGEALPEKNLVRNHSAGMLIFFGAVKRYTSDNLDLRLGDVRRKIIPVTGIHRPYLSQAYFSQLSPANAEQAYKALENRVRAYMKEMGAPQALVDRMFRSASNEIEFIDASEFKTLYIEEEPFLKEWLIAKCGDTRPPYSLTKAEYADFEKISWHQTTARRKDPAWANKPIGYLYPNPNYPQERVNALYKKVRAHNMVAEACQEVAVLNHQHEWAVSYTKAKNLAGK